MNGLTTLPVAWTKNEVVILDSSLLLTSHSQWVTKSRTFTLHYVFDQPTSQCVCAQSCLTLRSHGVQPTRPFCPLDSPGKNAEWVAISYPRISSWPRDWIWASCVSCIGRQVRYHCNTWKDTHCHPFVPTTAVYSRLHFPGFTCTDTPSGFSYSWSRNCCQRDLLKIEIWSCLSSI